MAPTKAIYGLSALLMLACAGGASAQADLASIARGGRLYEDWGKEVSIAGPRTYERVGERGRERPGRCVDCHGWDYRGKTGRTSAPGMAGAITARQGGDKAAVKAVLADSRHGYSDSLKDRDIEDLANFVVGGQFDMDAAGITSGALFRSMRRGGVVSDRRLTAAEVSRLLRVMAAQAGVMLEGISGHSTRIGAAQDAAAAGIGMPAILQAGGWRSAQMVTRYVRGLDAKRSASARLAAMQDRN